MNKLLTTPVDPIHRVIYISYIEFNCSFISLRRINNFIFKKAPVLSRSKGIEREIDEAKLEYRARRAINMEKKKLASKDRVKADLAPIDYERKLRKLATRGG